jgi:hypothetical protein
MQILPRILFSALVVCIATPAGAQQIVADSQRVANAIVRGLLPAIERYRGAANVTLGTGPAWIRSREDTTTIDSTSVWFKMVRSEMLQALPGILRDTSSARYKLHVALSSVSVAGDSVYVRAFFYQCDRGVEWFQLRPFDFTVKRVNGVWEASPLRFGSFPEGQCGAR